MTFKHWNHPSDEEEAYLQRTKTCSIWEGSFWGIFWGFGESYLVPFALFLGASGTVIAYVSTAPILIMAFAHVLGAVLLDRIGRRRPIISLGFFVQGFVFIPLLFLPAMASGIRMPLFLTMASLAFFAVGIARPSWVSLMGDVVEAEGRGAYFSRRERIVMCTMVIATLTAGSILQLHKNADNTAMGFTMLFGIALFGRSAGAALIRRHYDAPFPAPRQDQAALPQSVWQTFSANPNFIRFTVAVASVNGMFNIATPFFAVRMLKDLQWSYIQFTLSTVVFMTSQTLFIHWWGALCDRHGNRSVMLASSWLLAPFLLIWTFSHSFLILLFSQAISGAAWAGLNLSASNFIYDAVGQRGRAKAFSFYSLACGILSITGGVLIGARLISILPSDIGIAGFYVSMGSPVPVLFLLTALGCILVRVLLLTRFAEVRTAEPVTTTGILLQFAAGKPLRDLIGSMARRLRNSKRKQD